MREHCLSAFIIGFFIVSAVHARAQQPASPCETATTYHQLDFWVGEWDVFTPDGRNVGTNAIEKILRNCVVFENWVNVPSPTSSQAERADRAPCSTPEHHQFDFWIGEWNVITEDGRQAGANRIERILDGCVLQENWTGANGMRGQSFNIYSAADGKWHQTWVDTTGLRLELHGGMQDGRMVLSGNVRCATAPWCSTTFRGNA